MAITISGSTGIAGVDGSAGTPAVQGADTNTGMFFPAADTIAFAEGGAEAMRIDSSGNLLLGATSQVGLGGQLQISGANAVGGAGYNTFLTIQNTTGGATNPKKYFRINSVGGIEVINDGYTAAILVLDNSGILSFNSGYGSAAPAYGCRAWCTYNGVTSTIVASANISSVTKNSTGYYTFNFSTAMPDANYSTQANVQKDDANNDANAFAQAGGYATAKQTAALTYVITRRTSGLGAFDSPATYMAVFR